jgi:hypothetical protein
LKFEIKRPCPHCPFRRDCSPFLRRAGEIRDQMSDDHFWFACHETTGAKGGRRVKPENQSHCAGLMKVLWRMRRPNIAMRLALTFKMITVEQLEERRPAVFRSLAEFARHHVEADPE